MQFWSVSEVNRHLRRTLEEDAYLRDLWVVGEVSNLSVAMSGHAYFTLKDSASQLRCVIFRGQLQRLPHRPANGMLCAAHGALKVYEPQGTYQLYVEFLAPEGLGEAQLRLEELRLRLEAEGLFEPSRKRPLPRYPTRIGVVTSATGAVIHDIRIVLARRWPLAQLVLAPALVQGEDAPASISASLEDLNRSGDVEVIIVARGGGSREDLMAFNDERVARAIFASRVPVVSAVGHEVDVTIADLVADHRAPTPSAAAEVVSPDVREVNRDLESYAATLRWHLTRRLVAASTELGSLREALARRSPRQILVDRGNQVNGLAERLTLATQHVLDVNSHQLRARALQLSALDPLAILRRGYSVTYDSGTGRAVTSIEQVRPGNRLRTRVADGTFESTVEQASAGEASTP